MAPPHDTSVAAGVLRPPAPSLARRLCEQAWLLLVLATLSWAGNAIAGKVAAAHVSPAMLTFLRWLLAAVVVGVLARRHLRRDRAALLAAWHRVLVLGALGFACFNLALYGALAHTTALNVSIEQAAMPVLILLINFAAFRQRARIAQVGGIALTVAGVVVTATGGAPLRLLDADLNRGDAIMMLAVACYSTYAVLLRTRPAVHWLSLLFAMSVAALVVLTPVLAWECASRGCALPGAPAWGVLAYVVLFPTLLAQLCFMRGVELIGANRAGVFINLVPIFGAGLAVALLGEALEPYHAVGIGLVLAGVIAAERFAPRSG